MIEGGRGRRSVWPAQDEGPKLKWIETGAVAAGRDRWTTDRVGRSTGEKIERLTYLALRSRRAIK